MVEFVTGFYLALMFLALYMISFFIILTVRNRKKFFSYIEPKREYSITILIPAYNEQDTIKETISHVMQLDYPKEKLEVIVINDGSTDKTKEIVKKLLKKYSNLKLLDKKNSGKADSLNKGVKMSKGELLAVVDSDSFPSPHSLRKLTGYFNEENMGAVTSFVTVRNKDKNLFAKIQSIEYMILGWNRKLLDFIDAVYVTNGPLSLYRKKYIVKVGGFDPKSITEDIDITWNMLYHGFKTAMCLDARVSTIVPHKFKLWFRQRVRWGIGGMQAIQKYKASFLKNGIFGLFIMPFITLSIILSIVGFLFSSYLIFKSLFGRILITGYASSILASFLNMQNINLYPSVMIFYFIILFFVSSIYYNYILHKTKYDRKITLKRLISLSFYTIIFLGFYPLIWFAAIYRFVIKDYGW